MNSANLMSGFLRLAIKPTFASSNGLFAQQTRNTFILKRKFPLRLHAKDKKPQKFRARNWIYEVVENTNNKKKEEIELILTKYIAGTGNIGDRIWVKPEKAYSNYLMTGLAVYCNEENIEKYKKIMDTKEKREYSSDTVAKTITQLETMLIPVIVSQNHPWTLQKYHVRGAFRKIDVHVPDYAITMPDREITGPDLEKENKEFYVTVTINNKEKVKVRCRLHHYTSIVEEKIGNGGFYLKQGEAMFPEDQPILEAMPKPKHWETDTPVQSV